MGKSLRGAGRSIAGGREGGNGREWEGMKGEREWRA